jgi:hypothetical protein
MAANDSSTENKNQGVTDTTTLIIRRILGISGISAILTFVAVIQISLLVKILLWLAILIFWIGFEIILKKDISVLSSEARLRKVEFRASIVGVLLVILLAGAFQYADLRLTKKTLTAEKLYYMIVLDASEQMSSPLEGNGSRWNAVQSELEKFYKESNVRSNYGLVLIGGQNPLEKNRAPCLAPSLPFIPLVNENGRLRSQKDLSLDHLQTAVQQQKPEGGGSLSGAFSLAKVELENLPVDPAIKRIIVLIVSARDQCEGAVDWDSMVDDIQLVNSLIAVHKELILLDGTSDPEVAKFAEQVKQIPAPDANANTYVQVVNNYYQLSLSFANMLERLDFNGSNAPTPPAQTPQRMTKVATSSKIPRLPAVDEIETATKLNPETRLVNTPRLATFTPTTCSVIVSTLTTALPGSQMVCTATATITPLITFTPSFTLTPTIIIYPTAKPTRDRSDRPTNPPPPPPPPPPTEKACCMICTTGKACGDACIERTDTCTADEGCACNG